MTGSGWYPLEIHVPSLKILGPDVVISPAKEICPSPISDICSTSSTLLVCVEDCDVDIGASWERPQQACGGGQWRCWELWVKTHGCMANSWSSRMSTGRNRCSGRRSRPSCISWTAVCFSLVTTSTTFLPLSVFGQADTLNGSQDKTETNPSSFKSRIDKKTITDIL